MIIQICDLTSNLQRETKKALNLHTEYLINSYLIITRNTSLSLTPLQLPPNFIVAQLEQFPVRYYYCFFFFFPTYRQPGPSFISLFVQYSQSDLPPLRALCGEAPGRDSNPWRADLVAGTLTTRPPHLTTRPPHLTTRPPHLTET